jgi:CRISPR-associated protein Csd1
LLRLVLNRKRKESEAVIEPQVFETNDPAYNCGRLLAVLAAAQERAHQFSLEGPGVAERYFGAASASPTLVFPLLLRLNRHHLEKISKSGGALYIERRIQNIMAHFMSEAPGEPPEFPRHLNLQAQGRFAIGFYQEKAAAAAAAQRSAARQEPQNQPEQPEEVSK